MAAAVPEPIPTHVLEPEPGDNAWANDLADWLVDTAAEADMDPDQVAAELVLTPSEWGHAAWAPAKRAVGWSIDGPRTAEWAMAKVAEAKVQLAELQAQRDDWMLRIRHWFDQAAGRHLATAAFFEGHLQRYALAERDRTDGKVKTVTLPSGVVRTTASAAKPVVVDEAAVVDWTDEVFAESAEVVQAVAPASRRVLVSQLREVVALVEVVDLADVLLHTGEVKAWHRQAPGDTPPAVGDAWPQVLASPDDEPDGLVAELRVVDSHLEVRGPDGLPVPGVRVEPATVTAKVVPL